MKFSFSGRHMEVGESLSNRAKEACEALAAKYDVEFIDVNIVMKKDNYLFHTDISVKTGSGNSYMLSNESDDPIVSFEGVMPKLDAQMRKKKGNCRCGCKKKFVELNCIERILQLCQENSFFLNIHIFPVLHNYSIVYIRYFVQDM